MVPLKGTIARGLCECLRVGLCHVSEGLSWGVWVGKGARAQDSGLGEVLRTLNPKL